MGSRRLSFLQVWSGTEQQPTCSSNPQWFVLQMQTNWPTILFQLKTLQLQNRKSPWYNHAGWLGIRHLLIYRTESKTPWKIQIWAEEAGGTCGLSTAEVTKELPITSGHHFGEWTVWMDSVVWEILWPTISMRKPSKNSNYGAKRKTRGRNYA